MNLLSLAATALLVLSYSTDHVMSQCAVSKDKKDCYSEKYDGINVDAILQSSRLLKRYVDCLMDRGICTREGLFLKDVIPGVLQTECARCNESQKQTAGKLLSYMLQNKREWWTELVNKYDKDGLFRKKYGIGEDEDDEANIKAAAERVG